MGSMSIALSVLLAAIPVDDPAPAEPCWRPPVVAPVSDPFREPACKWCPGNRGVEYDTTPGTAVHSVGAGRVWFAGRVAGVLYVTVELPNGWLVTYGQLGSTRLATGDAVVAATIIGTAGESFHLGLRVEGRYRDPAQYLGALVGRRRLLPTDGRPPREPPRPRLVCGSGTGSVASGSSPLSWLFTASNHPQLAGPKRSLRRRPAG